MKRKTESVENIVNDEKLKVEDPRRIRCHVVCYLIRKSMLFFHWDLVSWIGSCDYWNNEANR